MKETLNLTQTSFPMKAQLPLLEPKILQYWQDHHVYQNLRDARKDAPKFYLNDGPPYANGPIHLGHAVNKILKDIIIKSKTLEGFDASFRLGWDCHGLPIEIQVEKNTSERDPAKFRSLCRTYAQSQIEIQAQGFQRLGILANYSESYKTMDAVFEAEIVRQISDFIKKGLLVSGFKPVHWCPLCASSLSDAETEFAPKRSHSLDVLFAVTEQYQEAGNSYPFYAIAWTTTPWTLAANQALAYHPQISYSVVIAENVAYLLESSKAKEFSSKYGLEVSRITPFDMEKLATLQYKNLFDEQKIHPFLPALYVTLDKGTGLVHTAPDHGPEDFQLGQEHHLKPLSYMDHFGRFTADAPTFLRGLSWTEAENVVIDELTQRRLLISQDMIEHSYLTCWRHKKPIFYRSTPQWFVHLTGDFKKQLLSCIETVRWHPQSGELRLKNMIENRPDWCISRQRHWGAPLVLVYHQKTRELHPSVCEIIETVAKKIEVEGLEAWYSFKLEDFQIDASEGWVLSRDTLDVWFDSGCVFRLLSQKKDGPFPADLYLEGNDQYRGWFQSSLICSLASEQQPPYKEVLTHGFLVDPDGKKMSKSLGNVVDPHDVAEKYGIDILRLWISLTNYQEDMAISPKILDQISETYRKLRNTLRFILANLEDFERTQHAIERSELTLIDKWMIERVFDLQEKAAQSYQKYQFSEVSRSVIDFCVNDLSAFYLDILKDRLYTCAKNSQARRSAQTALDWIFESLMHILLPLLPFTIEESWQHRYRHSRSSILLNTWPQPPFKNSIRREEQNFIEKILNLRKEIAPAIESLRQQGLIGSSLEVHLTVNVDPSEALWLNAAHELKFAFLVSSMHVQISHSPGFSVSVLENIQKCQRCWHRVDALVDQDICLRCEKNIHTAGESRAYV